MMHVSWKDPQIRLECAGQNTDAAARSEMRDDGLYVYLRAEQSRPTFIRLHWDASFPSSASVLGDTWERSYGDLQYRPIVGNDRPSPWYWIARDGSDCVCMGVRTQPNAFVSFRCAPQGVDALLDVRNGTCGVALGGRELLVCVVLYAAYPNCDDFDALCDFCRRMCPEPILPPHPVYGGNNWYYAYGKSSFAQIESDAALLAELTKDLAYPAYEVVDDGWQLYECSGPWLPNDAFGDMQALSDCIHDKGLRSGLWMRPLRTLDPDVPDSVKIRRGTPEYLDPTHPAAQAILCADLQRIRSWGFDLLKHDFTTFDLFGVWGMEYGDVIVGGEAWHFYDESKTNAEIVLDLYRLIRAQCQGMLILGCNTVSHLCAGLVEVNRTGNDTSGREWAPTVKNGVNTLAFRLPQNEAFYLADADCVGIIPGKIAWDNNRDWLRLLQGSGTALFTSCTDAIDENQRADLAAAFRDAAQRHTIKPLDRFDTPTPRTWQIDGETYTFDWTEREDSV